MQVLIVIMHPGMSPESRRFAIKMAKCLEAKASILSVIDLNRIARIASDEGLDKALARETLVEEAYENLYITEDALKNESIDVSIRTIEVSVPEELITEIKKSSPDIICLAGSVDTLWLEMIRGSLAIPVLLVPQGK